MPNPYAPLPSTSAAGTQSGSSQVPEDLGNSSTVSQVGAATRVGDTPAPAGPGSGVPGTPPSDARSDSSSSVAETHSPGASIAACRRPRGASATIQEGDERQTFRRQIPQNEGNTSRTNLTLITDRSLIGNQNLIDHLQKQDQIKEGFDDE